ncbi:3633_t:CDS:1, partial [Racocetra persica]
VLEYAPNNLIEEVKEYDEDGQPKNLMQSSRIHYEFCGELGIKRIYQSEFATYQPKFSLFYADHAGKRTPSWAEKKERSETVEGKPLLIPSDIHLKQLPDMKEKIQEALGGDS